MNRDYYFGYIEEQVNLLSLRISRRNKLNLLNLNIHSENFYENFLNMLFGWKLVNENKNKQNIAAIDLVDEKNKIVIQVSATATKEKIEKSLAKQKIEDYSGYNFKYVYIGNVDINDLRSKSYSNPFKIKFDPENDIHDVSSILSYLFNLNIENMKELYDFIKLELGSQQDVVKFDTDIASLINILSKDSNLYEDQVSISSFGIEKKITFNELDKAKYVISDFAIYHPRLEKKYSEFDSQGVHKSTGVLMKVRSEYLRNKGEESVDDLFFLIIDNLKTFVLESKNCPNISLESLELCVNVIVVHAFIECKIFKKPNK